MNEQLAVWGRHAGLGGKPKGFRGAYVHVAGWGAPGASGLQQLGEADGALTGAAVEHENPVSVFEQRRVAQLVDRRVGGAVARQQAGRPRRRYDRSTSERRPSSIDVRFSIRPFRFTLGSGPDRWCRRRPSFEPERTVMARLPPPQHPVYAVIRQPNDGTESRRTLSLKRNHL
jgi:hypothetical protein